MIEIQGLSGLVHSGGWWCGQVGKAGGGMGRRRAVCVVCQAWREEISGEPGWWWILVSVSVSVW